MAFRTIHMRLLRSVNTVPNWHNSASAYYCQNMSEEITEDELHLDLFLFHWSDYQPRTCEAQITETRCWSVCRCYISIIRLTSTHTHFSIDNCTSTLCRHAYQLQQINCFCDSRSKENITQRAQIINTQFPSAGSKGAQTLQTYRM